MTKYKAGDKVTIVLDKSLADLYSMDEEFGKTIISHEPAPEPIVKFGFMLALSGIIDYFSTLEHAKQESLNYYGVLGYLKITITGKDFTVEKVTE